MPRKKLYEVQRKWLSGLPRWARDPLVTCANTPLALLVTLVGSWCGFAFAFAWLEPDINWFDGLYLSSVVQSTLGFGDVLPSWWATKLLVMAYVFWCIYFLLPAAIFHIGERIIQARDSFSHEEQEELKAKVEDIQQTNNEILMTNARLVQLVEKLTTKQNA